MSTVLQFTPTAKTTSADNGRRDGGACEIVIFPGIRIERHDDGPHRSPDFPGGSGMDSAGDRRRPRKTS